MTVLPGHFSRLDEADDKGIFAASLDDIKRINAGLLAAGENDASTLELGKNVCALSQACKDSSGETP